MSTSRTSLSQQTPAVFGAPNLSPSGSIPSPAPVSTPIANTRPDQLSTVVLVIFTSIYAFFFPLHLGHFLIPGDAGPITDLTPYIALFAVDCVAFRHPLAQAIRQVVARKRWAILTLIMGGSVTLVIELVSGLTSPTLLNLAGLSGATLQNDVSIAEVTQISPPIIIVVVLGIVGPIAEEMFFRQFLTGLIKHFASTWVAVIVPSVLFGMLHMYSSVFSEILNVIPYAFFGFSCRLLHVKVNHNLLYPVSIHCLSNLNAFLPFPLY